MCLIVFAWKIVPGVPLIAAGNRDEFYDRPAAAAHWWEDQPDIYAGRDLQGGGTWMGVSRDGRFASITNIRAPQNKLMDAPSRGELVAGYLAGKASAREFIDALAGSADRYNGFNLLLGDGDELIWYSNGRIDDPRNGKPLAPGIYGLSNASLDVPWPKVVNTRAQFASHLAQGAPDDAYFDMLSDTTRSPDTRLPQTGIGIEWERLLSSVCIESPAYGTRVSSLVRVYDRTAESCSEYGRFPLLSERLVK
jgi:uncharacterized protein with NRDE domain